MRSAKEITPDELQLAEGLNRDSNIDQNTGETMISIVPHTATKFDTSFEISTGNATISIESSADYWDNSSLAPAIRLTDNAESLLIFSAAEALSVAAALQAVAVHLMEGQPREIRRAPEVNDLLRALDEE